MHISDLVCFIIPFVGMVAVVIALGVLSARFTASVRNQAYAAYQDALEALKADPGNAALREKALDLGEVYSRTTGGRGFRMFNHAAVLRDIERVTAGAPGSASGARH